MRIKDYVKQYTNEDLCKKWDNNIPLSELHDPELMLLTDSQDIDFICEFFSFLPHQDLTGYLASVYEGDYIEVYLTESSNPFAEWAIYHPLEYYL